MSREPAVRENPTSPIPAHVRVAGLSVPGRLAPVTFDAVPGGAVALVGTNGTGKTTLLRLLAGFGVGERSAGTLRTRRAGGGTGGTITVNGALPNRRDGAFRAMTAALFDSTELDPSLTFGEHARVLAASWGDAHAQESTAAEEGTAAEYSRIAQALGIAHLTDRFGHEASSGERQLMRLTTVLARPASLLILDEPEQRLAKRAIGALAGVLRERLEAGATIIVATHREDLVDGIGATRIEMTAP